MNLSRQQILPVQFVATACVRIAVQPGKIRRHGAAPLLLKSVPARMAAAQAPSNGR